MTTEMEMERAQYLIEHFVERFEPSYLLLAYHAALPLVLTPELVSYLRTRFLQGQVPWVAEADLLLSNLCRPVGYEQYVMETAVRAYLLAEMEAHPDLGLTRMQDVARLLIQYTRHLAQTNSYLSQFELRSQQWAAISYFEEHKETVAREIVAEFKSGFSIIKIGEKLQIDAQALMALCNITQILSPKLESFRELLNYSVDVSNMVHKLSEQNHSTELFEPLRSIRLFDLDLPTLDFSNKQDNTTYRIIDYPLQQQLSLSNTNPFIPYTTAVGDRFFSREKEIRYLVNRLENSESAMIVSIAKMGKSSLLQRLMDQSIINLWKRNPNRLVFSYIDLGRIDEDYTTANFWRDAIRPFLQREAEIYDEPDYTSYRALTQFLNRTSQFEKKSLVLLLDSFNTLLSHSNFQDTVFFASLRSIATRNNVSVIGTSDLSISLMHQHMTHFNVAGSPPLNYMTEVRLGPLTKQAVNLILEQAKISLSNHEHEFIYKFVGGNPYLVQLIASIFYELPTKQENRIETVQERCYPLLRDYFDNLWRQLDNHTKTASLLHGLHEIYEELSKINVQRNLDNTTETNLPALNRLLIKHFNLDEFKILCHNLQIKYDDLGGETISSKTNELILYCQRHVRLKELILILSERRPNVSWPSTSSQTHGTNPSTPVFQLPDNAAFDAATRKLEEVGLQISKVQDAELQVIDAFKLWVQDLLITEKHEVKDFNKWLKEKKYKDLVTEKEWNRAISLAKNRLASRRILLGTNDSQCINDMIVIAREQNMELLISESWDDFQEKADLSFFTLILDLHLKGFDDHEFSQLDLNRKIPKVVFNFDPGLYPNLTSPITWDDTDVYYLFPGSLKYPRLTQIFEDIASQRKQKHPGYFLEVLAQLIEYPTKKIRRFAATALSPINSEESWQIIQKAFNHEIESDLLEYFYSLLITANFNRTFVLQKHVNEFLRNIEPTAQEKLIASQELEFLKTNLANVEQIRDLYLTTIPIGSYERDTAVKFLSDMDMLVLFHGSEARNIPPRQLFKLFRDAIYELYRSRTDHPNAKQFGRFTASSFEGAITIQYPRTRRIEIIFGIAEAVVENKIRIVVPDRRMEKWVAPNFGLHKKITQEKNQISDGNYSSLVKMIKIWQRNHSPKGVWLLSGFTLECLIAEHFDSINKPILLDSFGDLIRLIATRYGNHNSLRQVPVFGHRAVKEIRFTRTRYNDFINVVEQTISLLDQAKPSNNISKELEIWHKILGVEFPQKLY